MHMHSTSVSINTRFPPSKVAQYVIRTYDIHYMLQTYMEQPVVLCEVYIINNVEGASETTKLGNYSFGKMKFRMW